MHIYPGIQATLGTWTYYIVKMTARELSESVKLAADIYEDHTLSDAIQRTIDESRVKNQIVKYLKSQPDHFFSSIVIAAIEGNPLFYPVEITADEKFKIFRDQPNLNNAFGVLVFDGTQKYYALDGQHRLLAIKTQLSEVGLAHNFAKEEFSVIVVLPHLEEDRESFFQKYRRLFANLNRYAKPTDKCTNIIMDEDDAIAIITRRLITDHKYFKSPGKQKESFKIKTTRGANLNASDPFFTSLEALYDINIELLNSSFRRNDNWGEENKSFREFITLRPSDQYIDGLYKELEQYWNTILAEFPILAKEPPKMRIHNPTSEPNQSDEKDHLLFWPIGQELLAQLVRRLLDKKMTELGYTTQPLSEEEVKKAIRGINRLQWHFHEEPWIYFLLIKDNRDRWKIRNEERKQCLEVGLQLLLWLTGYVSLTEEEIEDLKSNWASRLIPAQRDDEVNQMWNKILAQKISISR